MSEGPDDTGDAFAERLRAVRAVPPRLDRDRLMYLAGRRSAAPRRSRLWPLLTAASWLSCAAVVAVLASRPAKVVTQIRTVERVVEVPVSVPAGERTVKPALQSLADTGDPRPTRRTESPSPAVVRDGGSWTLLSSRSADFQDEGPLAFAGSLVAVPSGSPSPRSTPTFGELRRELFAEVGDEETGTDSFHWF